MVILVCGSREWTNRDSIAKALSEFDPDETTVIHGDCRGADRHGADIAARMGFAVRAYPAKWKELGRKAGVVRNQQMLDDGKPDLVLAFTLGTSGTADMIRRASIAGVMVRTYTN